MRKVWTHKTLPTADRLVFPRNIKLILQASVAVDSFFHSCSRLPHVGCVLVKQVHWSRSVKLKFDQGTHLTGELTVST